MRQFLLRFFRFLGMVYVGYLLLLLLLITVFKYLIPDFHSDKGNFSDQYQEAFERSDAELLVIGSSRALASLDSPVLTRELGLQTYNLAFTQSSITYNYHLLKYYLDRCGKLPKYVVLDVSWFSFDNQRLSYKEYAAYFAFNSPQLFYDDLLLNKRRPIINGLVTLGRALERRNRPDLNFDNKRARISNQDSTLKSYQFDPMDDGFLRTFLGGKSKMVQDEMESFEELVQLLEARQIPLILYTSPEDELFSQSQKNREQVYDYLRKHSKNLYWMDYSLGGNLYSKEYENLLIDSHHIHFKDSFSQIFAADLKRQMLVSIDQATVLQL